MFKLFSLTFIYLLGFSVLLSAQNLSSINEQDIANEVKIAIKQILKDEIIYRKLDKKIFKYNDKIIKNQIMLDDMNKKKNVLEQELTTLREEQNTIESNIITLTVKKYSKSVAIKYANKKSSQSILDNEVYFILQNNIKKEVLKYNEVLKALIDKISVKIVFIEKLTAFKKEQENLVLFNQNLKNKREKSLQILRKKHKYYILKLVEINKNQEKMQNLLVDLSLVKKAKKSKNTKLKNITPSSKEFESKVSGISKNSTSVSIYEYNEMKTIAPFKKYTIINKFGIYYDSVYKAELFNKSISLKTTKKNTRVRSILDGKITFIKRDDKRFKNIVIVKYDNDLNTIYSNLDGISSEIFVGMKVLKGFTLGRVDETLILQATKNNKYIDPEKLFK